MPTEHTDEVEPVLHAPQEEPARGNGELDLVERSVAFSRQLGERAGPNPQLIDKAFVDDLCERC